MPKSIEPANVPDHIPPELVYQWQPSDFPDFETDPYGLYRKLARADRPIFFTPNHVLSDNGAWVVTSAEYCREIVQQADPFTTTIPYGGDKAVWPRRLIPLMMDPPEHGGYRRLIASIFSPKIVDSLDSFIKQVANELIDELAGKGKIDFMSSFARLFPGIVFMRIMGLPLEMKEQFFEWEEKFFHDGTVEERKQVGIDIAVYLDQLIDEKKKNPGQDLISELTTAEVDGKPLEKEIIQDYCFLMYIAGLDTVNGGLGHLFKWLAENPEEQRLLRQEPERIPLAIEELLRIHTWINVTRVCSRDHDFHGVPMKAGDRVLVLFAVSSWDENRFECPFEIDLERKVNPHLAFGGGNHRCAGSFLARRELTVAITEWLKRIPEFRITEGESAPYFVDGLLSLRKLSLSWNSSEVT